MWCGWVKWGFESGVGIVEFFYSFFFPEVLISRSNEQAAVHGHQAIIFGYHANSEHVVILRNRPRVHDSGSEILAII